MWCSESLAFQHLFHFKSFQVSGSGSVNICTAKFRASESEGLSDETRAEIAATWIYLNQKLKMFSMETCGTHGNNCCLYCFVLALNFKPALTPVVPRLQFVMNCAEPMGISQLLRAWRPTYRGDSFCSWKNMFYFVGYTNAFTFAMRSWVSAWTCSCGFIHWWCQQLTNVHIKILDPADQSRLAGKHVEGCPGQDRRDTWCSWWKWSTGWLRGRRSRRRGTWWWWECRRCRRRLNFKPIQELKIFFTLKTLGSSWLSGPWNGMSLSLLQTWFEFWLQPSDGNSPCKSSPSGSGGEKKRFVFNQWHCQHSSTADRFKHISSFYHFTASIPSCSIWAPL